jgi:hypothetical protein
MTLEAVSSVLLANTGTSIPEFANLAYQAVLLATKTN